MSHYIYLIQVREFVANNEPTYKIGKTTQDPSERFKGYPSGTKVYLIISVHDCHSLEKELIQDFHKIFVFRKEYGNETFSGDVYHMCDVIYSKAKLEHIRYKTQKDNDIIRKNISKIKAERIKNTDNTPNLLTDTSSDNNDYFDNLDIIENVARIELLEIPPSDDIQQKVDEISGSDEIRIVKSAKKTSKGPKKTLETFYKHLYESEPSWYKENTLVDLATIATEYDAYFNVVEDRAKIVKILADIFITSKRIKGVTKKMLSSRDKLKKLF